LLQLLLLLSAVLAQNWSWHVQQQQPQLQRWLLEVLSLPLLLPAKAAAEVAVGWLLASAAGLMSLLLLLL
jgi:hypothetical protein